MSGENERFGYDWHWPRVYRYRVAHPRRFHALLNRYPGCVIGCAIVVGKFAYCIKWSNVGPAHLPNPRQEAG